MKKIVTIIIVRAKESQKMSLKITKKIKFINLDNDEIKK